MSFVYEEVLLKDINFKLYLCNFSDVSQVVKAGIKGKKFFKLWGRLGFDSESNWVVST